MTGGAAGMAAVPATQPKAADAGASTPPTMPADAPTKAVVYWLDILANSVWRANADGSGAAAIVTGNGVSAPDGVAVDVEDGHLYWTNMGSALGGANLGTVQRATLDGTSVETIVPAGVGNTFKQMTIDHVSHKVYWCDREGAKVWRSNFDGSQHEVLVSGHGIDQAVGVALDVPRAQFYFTDRNARKILRAGFQMPAGQNDMTRTDLEELFVFAAGAMPIDLDLDLDQRMIYWTDRSLGTVQRASMDLPAGQSASTRKDAQMLVTGLSEPIGISLDLKAGTMYFGELSGSGVSRANLDGSNRVPVARSGSITGVTLVHLPIK
jgi:sugar lactone lactonase YvrE